MKVLILGGFGFLGSHIARSMLKGGHKLRILDRAESNHSHLSGLDIEICYGQLGSEVDVRNALSGMDIVINLVSFSWPKTPFEDAATDILESILPAVKLIEACHDKGIKRILFASSGGTVYGEVKNCPISEDHPCLPISLYGLSKRISEEYLRMAWLEYNIEVVILRASNPYGPLQNLAHGQGFITACLDCIIKDKPIAIWVNLDTVRDFLWVGDVASAFVGATLVSATYDIFNIGSGVQMKLSELINIIEKITNRKLGIRNVNKHHGSVSYNVLDISRAKKKIIVGTKDDP